MRLKESLLQTCVGFVVSGAFIDVAVSVPAICQTFFQVACMSSVVTVLLHSACSCYWPAAWYLKAPAGP